MYIYIYGLKNSFKEVFCTESLTNKNKIKEKSTVVTLINDNSY